MKVGPLTQSSLKTSGTLLSILTEMGGAPHIPRPPGCIFPWRNWCGAVAQLGERRVRNAKVRGSIPLGSTNLLNDLNPTGSHFQSPVVFHCAQNGSQVSGAVCTFAGCGGKPLLPNYCNFCFNWFI